MKLNKSACVAAALASVIVLIGISSADASTSLSKINNDEIIEPLFPAKTASELSQDCSLNCSKADSDSLKNQCLKLCCSAAAQTADVLDSDRLGLANECTEDAKEKK